MSIIYDALKKTQQVRSDISAIPASDNLVIPVLQRNRRAAILVGVLFILIVLSIFQFRWKNVALPVAAPVLTTAEDEIFKNKHLLNGVFLSDNEKVAMINNKFYHIGNSVDGLKLVQLKLNQVTLKNEKMTVTLDVAEF